MGYVVLNTGDQLNRNGSFVTPSNEHQLILQDDGNLVLYQLAGDDPNGKKYVVWASNTYGQNSQYAIMQPDGNFVIYGPDNPPNALWASGTNGQGTAPYTLEITEDLTPDGAELQIVDSNGSGLWTAPG